MIREDGYYWVKVISTNEWHVLRYDGYWCDSESVLTGYEQFSINENRIHNPDELALGPPIVILKNDSKAAIVRGTSEVDGAEAHTEVDNLERY